MNAWPLAVFCVTVAVVLYLVIAEPAVTVPATWLRGRKPWRIVLSYGMRLFPYEFKSYMHARRLRSFADVAQDGVHGFGKSNVLLSFFH